VRPLPPPQLNTNKKTEKITGTKKYKSIHWSTRAGLTRIYREGTKIAALAVSKSARPMWTKAVCKLIFYFPNARRRDKKNFEGAMKAAYDGLVDAGIITDDNSDVLSHEDSEMHIDRKNPRVEMFIKRLEALNGGRYRNIRSY